MKQKIMFFYLKTGGGHIACANSLREYLAKAHPDAEVIMVDGFEGSSRIERFLIEDSYRISQNYAKWAFDITLNLNRSKAVWKGSRKLLTKLMEDNVHEAILTHKPDKIITFHCFLIPAIQDTIEEIGKDIPLLVFVTDPYEPIHAWFTDRRPNFIFMSENGKKTAIKNGVACSRCKVIGPVLQQRYGYIPKPQEIDRLRKKLGYPKGRKVILIVGGGDGIPKGFQIISRLLASRVDAEIAIVCGKNALLQKEAELLAKGYKNLHVYGFVDFVYDLLNISDVVITKCGASIFMEILLQGKIPIINTYLGIQEVGNKDFVVNSRLGFYEPRVSRLPKLLKRILTDQDTYSTFRRNLKKANLKNQAAEVAEYIYSFKGG